MGETLRYATTFRGGFLDGLVLSVDTYEHPYLFIYPPMDINALEAVDSVPIPKWVTYYRKEVCCGSVTWFEYWVSGASFSDPLLSWSSEVHHELPELEFLE